MFKKLLFLLALVCPAFAQSNLTCNVQSNSITHGQLASCSLPTVPVGGCVKYQFNIHVNSGGFSLALAVNLNTSAAQSTGSFLSQTGEYVVSGKVCADGSQLAQRVFADSVLNDVTIAFPPSSSTQLVEDLSVASALTFVATVQRGFGVQFNGGTVEVIQP